MTILKRLVIILIYLLTACTGTPDRSEPRATSPAAEISPTGEITRVNASPERTQREQPAEHTPERVTGTFTPVPPRASPTVTATSTPPATLEVPEPTTTLTPTPTLPPPTATSSPPVPEAEPPVPASAETHLARLHPNLTPPDLARMPHYVVSAELTESRLEGQLRLHFPNHGTESLNDVVLRLYGNATTIYTGSSTRVDDVMVNGEPAAVQEEVGGTAIRIHLPAPLTSGTSVDITLSFVTQVPSQSFRGYGIQQAARGITVFGSPFPMLALRDGSDWRVPAVPAVGDGASAPFALWDLFIQVPDGRRLVTTGEPASIEGGLTHVVTGPVRDLALVSLPGGAQPIERSVAGTHLRYWPADFVSGNHFSASEAANIAASAVEAYVAEFGPPPYRHLDVIEAQVPIGGYEYPSLVLFDGPRRSNADREALHFLIPHEIAHQWFFALVGNDVTGAPWIDEGLATYGNLRYTYRARGAEVAAQQRAGWEQEYAAVLARRPVGVNRPASHFGDWVSYRGPTYYAPAIMFDDLRGKLGDSLFQEAMQRLISRYAFKQATTEGVRQIFNEAAAENGIDLSDFWSRWFR